MDPEIKFEFMIRSGYLELGEEVQIQEGVTFVDFAGRDGKIEIGDKCILRSGCVIYGGCKFENNVKIGHNTILLPRTIIGKNTYLGGLVMCDGDILIGEGCGIQTQSYITRYTVIGNFVFFAPQVCTTNDWEMKFRRKGHGEELIGPTIGDMVRIGSMATLLPGIEIGKHSVIGAGSVVTKNVPNYEKWFGNPARKIDDINPEDDELIYQYGMEKW